MHLLVQCLNTAHLWSCHVQDESNHQLKPLSKSSYHLSLAKKGKQFPSIKVVVVKEIIRQKKNYFEGLKTNESVGGDKSKCFTPANRTIWISLFAVCTCKLWNTAGKSTHSWFCRSSWLTLGGSCLQPVMVLYALILYCYQ